MIILKMMISIKLIYIPLIVTFILYLFHFIFNKFSFKGFKNNLSYLFAILFGLAFYFDLLFYGIGGLIWLWNHINIVM